ncbi:MAG: CocE/NonD family hydrolase [Pseudomonadota bacterium]
MTNAGPEPQRGSGPAFFRRRNLIVAAVVLALFVIGPLIATWAIQRYVTFPSPPDGAWNPQARIDNGGEQVWLDADGARVEAWYLPPTTAAATAPLIIYAHGNAELIDMRAGDFATLRAAGVAVLQVEYPGYGRSEGSPSEESLTAALVAAYDWAAHEPRIDTRRIAGYGRSLGGGAIAQLAARRELAALVLESTFYNFEDIVAAYGVPRMFLINHFDTGAVVRRYPGPVLLMHGTHDRVFQSEEAEKLAEASGNSSLHLDACGHNDCPRHWDLVLRFLAQNGVCRKPDPETSHEIISVC